MSRSLNRVRSLVSEIEQIQKRGQMGAAPSLMRSVSDLEADRPMPEERPNDSTSNVVRLESPVPVEKPTVPGRVSVQWSGSVTLELQIENSNERMELKQVGDSIEIRFEDGKAFHIPLKAVA